jgi:hypothetical protein
LVSVAFWAVGRKNIREGMTGEDELVLGAAQTSIASTPEQV